MKKSSSARGGRKQYWVDSAKRLGLIDTTHGIHFIRDPYGPLPALGGPSGASPKENRLKKTTSFPSFDNDHVAVGGHFPSPYTSTSISPEEVLPTTQLSMPMNTFTQRNAQSTGNFVPLEPLIAKMCFQHAPSSFTTISSSPPNGHRTDDERDQIYERLARVAVEKFVAMKKA